MSERKGDYEVGYGKPPKETRFKKGRTGNPKGRPKGAKGLKACLKRELETKITIREGGREIKVSKAEAMAKQIIARGLKGETKPSMELLKIDGELFGEGDARHADPMQPVSPEPVDLKILEDYFLQLDSTGDKGTEEDDDEIA